MKKSTEKYFDKAIYALNKMGIKNENIIVTGSVALDILGVLPENHKIHDFDCILNIEKEKLGMFKLMCELFKSDAYPSYCEDNSRIIDVFGVTINLWFNIPNETSIIKYKGVGVKSLTSILKEKKKYKRDKDIKDIYEITKIIIN